MSLLPILELALELRKLYVIRVGLPRVSDPKSLARMHLSLAIYFTCCVSRLGGVEGLHEEMEGACSIKTQTGAVYASQEL